MCSLPADLHRDDVRKVSYKLMCYFLFQPNTEPQAGRNHSVRWPAKRLDGRQHEIRHLEGSQVRSLRVEHGWRRIAYPDEEPSHPNWHRGLEWRLGRRWLSFGCRGTAGSLPGSARIQLWVGPIVQHCGLVPYASRVRWSPSRLPLHGCRVGY